MAGLIFTCCNADACFYQSRCAGKVFLSLFWDQHLEAAHSGDSYDGQDCISALALWRSQPHVSPETRSSSPPLAMMREHLGDAG